jgi:hypothetical protein
MNRGNIEHRTTNIEQRTTNIEQRTSNNEHRTTNIEQRTSNIEQRTSNAEHRMKESPHLTLTLSAPIRWERRGNSRWPANLARQTGSLSQVHGPNACAKAKGGFP